MSPATIAIIPLVLVTAGAWAAIYRAFREDDTDVSDAIPFAILCTLLSLAVAGTLAYLAGVVVFNDWGFLA